MDGPYVFVEALNMGPLSNRIAVVWMRKSWWDRKIKRDHTIAHINPDYGHYATTDSGARIEVGDRATFVFPYNKEVYLREDGEDTFLNEADGYAEIGVTDGYGRFHWAPKKQFIYLKEKIKTDFL